MSRTRLHYYLAAWLLLLLFAQAVSDIPALSVTVDEPVHALTGYSILRTGDLRLLEDHPPLIEMWLGWPLLLSPEIPHPAEVPSWQSGNRRLFAYDDYWWQPVANGDWLFPARFTNVLLSLLLGALLYRWATDWFGSRAGLLALGLFACDPNVLAHASLATLDLGVTALIFATLYSFQRCLRHPTTTRVTGAGLLLGLALSAKISAAPLPPLTAALMLIWGFQRWEKKMLLRRLALFAGSAFLALWAAHLFQIGFTPELPFRVPAPTYWHSFFRVGQDASGGARYSFLLGDLYQGGRWYYFPVALLLKTPLPTLLLSVAALIKLWRWPLPFWQLILLSAFPISYLLVSIAANINIGYRHILSIVPFLYLGIGSLAAHLGTAPAGESAKFHSGIGWKITRYASRYVLPALLLWQCGGTLAVAPYHLTFFNELAGGPANGWRYLSDSNVDWGQSLKAVQRYLAQQTLERVYLSTPTNFVQLPQLYDFDVIALPPDRQTAPMLPARYNPFPGTYIIGATSLRGLVLTLPEMYNWFWHREPDEIIANAMLVYHITAREPKPTWVGQCNVPVTPLSAEMIQNRFWRSDLRQLDFDCTQSWLYPGNGLESGWVALHRELLPAPGDFLQRQLSLLNLSFEQAAAHAAPPHSIFEWQPLSLPLPTYRPYQVAPAATSPVQLAANVPLTVSLALDGPLDFLGYEIRAVALPEIITYWRVTAVPEAPFSLMAHLATGDGQLLEVVDGLGVTWHQLRPGDVLAQRHLFTTPPEQPANELYLRTGAYWLADGARWPSLAYPDADAIFIPLAPE